LQADPPSTSRLVSFHAGARRALHRWAPRGGGVNGHRRRLGAGGGKKPGPSPQPRGRGRDRWPKPTPVHDCTRGARHHQQGRGEGGGEGPEKDVSTTATSLVGVLESHQVRVRVEACAGPKRPVHEGRRAGDLRCGAVRAGGPGEYFPRNGQFRISFCSSGVCLGSACFVRHCAVVPRAPITGAFCTRIRLGGQGGGCWVEVLGRVGHRVPPGGIVLPSRRAQRPPFAGRRGVTPDARARQRGRELFRPARCAGMPHARRGSRAVTVGFGDPNLDVRVGADNRRPRRAGSARAETRFLERRARGVGGRFAPPDHWLYQGRGSPKDGGRTS